MASDGMEPHWNYYAQLLESCNTPGATKQIHLYALKKGITSCLLSIGNRLLQVYVRCGSNMSDARKLFDEMPLKNCYTWNTMIEGYMKTGKSGNSLELFNLMPRREKNDFSWNLIISGLAKAGDLVTSRVLLWQMPRRNGVVWNSVIHGYSRHGCPKEALRAFKQLNSDPAADTLDSRDAHVLASALGACSDIIALDCGKQIHARIIVDCVKLDSVLASSLVALYAKCGDFDNARRVLKMVHEPNDFSLSALIVGYSNKGRTDDARKIFNHIDSPCIVVCNSMIAGYVSNNEDMEALALFKMLRRKGVVENFSTLSSLLSACANASLLALGKQLHGHSCKVGVLKDVVFASSLVDMYSKCKCHSNACKFFDEIRLNDTILLNAMINVYSNCGRVQEAKHMFNTMQHRTLISWNSILSGLSQNGYPLTALEVFHVMNKLTTVHMDEFSLASVISAAASISSLEFGEQAFARAFVIGLEAHPVISTSLVDFYCKCGFVDIGRKIFNIMVALDVVSWNSILVGYAINGRGSDALNLFYDMLIGGPRPSKITFMAVLSACDHCGLVDEARKWFSSMQYGYNIDPGYEHYSCMVNLFSRTGLLEEAMHLIKQTPFNADASLWSSVLRGCVAHGNKILSEKVANIVLELDPENSDAYVKLSGVLAAAGEWEGSKHMRDMMQENCKVKIPGLCWGGT